MSILYGHSECVKVLHQLGADINAKDKYKCSAVMRAAKYGHSECVKVLNELGAKDDNGCATM